jgi:HKD family nuclease
MSHVARPIANHTLTAAAQIREFLPRAHNALFAVAYGTFDGLSTFGPQLGDFLGRHGKFKAILDVDRHFTDPLLIDDLYTMPGDIECKLFAPRIKNPSIAHGPAFHPKIYYFDDNKQAAAIVGSSNLSLGGLERNYESSLVIQGDFEDPVFVELRALFEAFWNNPDAIHTSVYPKFREAYAEAYKKARLLNPRPGIPLEVPLAIEPSVLAELQAAFGKSKDEVIIAVGSYLAGLISGGLASIDFATRTISIKIQRGTLNRGNPFEGKIHFPEVSERNLDQVECVLRDAERIEERLRSAFDDTRSGDKISRASKAGSLVHLFTIEFSKDSRFWLYLKELYGTSFRRLAQYMFPARIDRSNKEALENFAKGYMHVRTRISVTDRYPNGDLRVAISASGSATRFAKQFQKLLLELFDSDESHMTLLDGADRNRETLIRFDPAIIPPEFLLSPWQQLVVDDFKKYNLELKAVRNKHRDQLTLDSQL